MASQNITRRDILSGTAVAAAVTATGSPITTADEPQPEKKIRIGVVGGGFGASFFWHEHPNCVDAGVTDLRPERRKYLKKIYKCDQAYDSMEVIDHGGVVWGAFPLRTTRGL